MIVPLHDVDARLILLSSDALPPFLYTAASLHICVEAVREDAPAQGVTEVALFIYQFLLSGLFTSFFLKSIPSVSLLYSTLLLVLKEDAFRIVSFHLQKKFERGHRSLHTTINPSSRSQCTLNSHT